MEHEDREFIALAAAHCAASISANVLTSLSEEASSEILQLLLSSPTTLPKEFSREATVAHLIAL
jgi:uncharacterized protein (DUF1778 family)